MVFPFFPPPLLQINLYKNRYTYHSLLYIVRNYLHYFHPFIKFSWLPFYKIILQQRDEFLVLFLLLLLLSFISMWFCPVIKFFSYIWMRSLFLSSKKAINCYNLTTNYSQVLTILILKLSSGQEEAEKHRTERRLLKIGRHQSLDKGISWFRWNKMWENWSGVERRRSSELSSASSFMLAWSSLSVSFFYCGANYLCNGDVWPETHMTQS